MRRRKKIEQLEHPPLPQFEARDVPGKRPPPPERVLLLPPGKRAATRSAACGDVRSAQLRERRLRRGEPRERHAVWRARDVVEPDPVAECDRARVAAVLAA